MVSGAGAWLIGMSIILEIAVLFHVQNLIILSSPSLLCLSQKEGLETSDVNIRSCHLCKRPTHPEMQTSAVLCPSLSVPLRRDKPRRCILDSEIGATLQLKQWFQRVPEKGEGTMGGDRPPGRDRLLDKNRKAKASHPLEEREF